MAAVFLTPEQIKTFGEIMQSLDSDPVLKGAVTISLERQAVLIYIADTASSGLRSELETFAKRASD